MAGFPWKAIETPGALFIVSVCVPTCRTDIAAFFASHSAEQNWEILAEKEKKKKSSVY